VNPQAVLTNTRSIAKNSIAPTVLNLFNRGIDFVFAAFYLRYLGPAEAGGYATAITIAGLFEIIANFGLNTFLIREVSQNKEQASRYLLNTTVLRLGTGVAAALPILVYILSRQLGGNPLGNDVLLAVGLIMVGMVFSGMGQGLAGLYYAYEQAEFPAAITTVTTIFKVGFGVMVLLLGYGFVGLAGVSILVNIITLVILVISALRRFHLPGPWRLDLTLQRQMIYLSYPLMINHLFAVIFFQVDVLVLQQLKGDEVVGWYNSAYKYVNALNVIPSFFTFALFPVISRQVKHSLDDARRSFQMAIKIMALISLPLAVIITLTAPVLIGVLGGSAFLPHGAIALQIVVWSIPIGWLNSVTNYVLIALGQERLQTRAFLIGVGFNLIGNLLLIPRYSYAAAGVITILSEIVLLYVFNWYLVKRMPEVGWFRLLARPALVTLVMAVVGVLGSQLHLVVGVALALAVYPLGLWALRVFGAEERQIAAAILPGRMAKVLRLKS
jgi:O-antigen/teichoic acid export membrane protein